MPAVRTLFLSDIHLGTRACQAEHLIEFLREHPAEQTYLIGDIVDFWAMHRGICWLSAHNTVVQKLLRRARHGERIVFIPGNHDEVLRDYPGVSFGGIEVHEEAIHTTADGRRLLLIHGDIFDQVTRHHRWVAVLGDMAYTQLVRLNLWLSWVRRKLGRSGYWSLAGYAKRKVKTALNFIFDFEESAVHHARERGLDGVICGHIHWATMRDIDGLCTASVTSTMWPMPVVEYLGLAPSFIDGTMLGGSSFIAHLMPALLALDAGLCNAVLVCYGSTQRSGNVNRAAVAAARRALDPQPYEAAYEPPMPVAAYALAASRHMAQYGTTRRQLAEVAVAARAWAQRNPEAFDRGPLTIDQVLASRMVADPLTVRDCCLVTDGAGAYVLQRAEDARGAPRPPAYLLGQGTACVHRQISSMPDLTTTAARESGAAAYAMAGLAPRDVNVVELYDAFTINTLLFLEDLGFCAKGEGGAFVQDGGIGPGGRLPVNTNGGGLSCTHPGMYGIFALIEAVRQLRGDGGERQVPGAAIALAHGNGGTLSSQATAILGTGDSL